MRPASCPGANPSLPAEKPSGLEPHLGLPGLFVPSFSSLKGYFNRQQKAVLVGPVQAGRGLRCRPRPHITVPVPLARAAPPGAVTPGSSRAAGWPPGPGLPPSVSCGVRLRRRGQNGTFQNSHDLRSCVDTFFSCRLRISAPLTLTLLFWRSRGVCV